MSSKATKVAIEAATLDAIERADHFTASIRVKNSQTTYPLKSLAQAREAAKLMPEALGALTKAMVYAVTPEGRAFLVPEDFPDPSTPDGREAAMNLVAMAEKIGNQTHKAGNGVTLAGPEPTPAPEAGKAAKVDDDDIPAQFKRPPMTPAQKAELQAKTKAELNKVPAVRSPASPPAKSATAQNSTAPSSAKSAQSTPVTTTPAKGTKPAADNSSKEPASMSTKASKNKARTAVKAKSTKPAKAGERSRYDWNGAEEAAAKGTLPKRPDFSADTHERFRPLLKEVADAVAKAAEAKGAARSAAIDALKKIKVNPVSSSPKAVDRYRKIALKALAAQKAA